MVNCFQVEFYNLTKNKSNRDYPELGAQKTTPGFHRKDSPVTYRAGAVPGNPGRREEWFEP